MGPRPARRELLTAAVFAGIAGFEFWATGWTLDLRGVTVAVAALVATSSVAWRVSYPAMSALTCYLALGVLTLADEADHLWVYVLVVIVPFFAARNATPRRAVGVLAAGLFVDVWSGFYEPWSGWVNFLANYAFVAILMTVIPWSAGFSLSRRQRQGEQRAETAVEEERLRIAREIHDVVGHALGVIAVQAGAERLTLPPDAAETTTETLTAIETTAREALTEMRRMLKLLRMDSREVDPMAPQPGLAQMTSLLESVTAAGMHPELVVLGEPVPLAPGVDLSAYRIVQEALTNALKHGGSQQGKGRRAASGRVTVTLRYLSGSLEIEVIDDGAQAPAHSPSGFGLAGMMERVAVYGGSLATGARPRGQYAVTVRLPTGAGAT
jgi:signal transduction histidine kinase